MRGEEREGEGEGGEGGQSEPYYKIGLFSLHHFNKLKVSLL